MYFGETKPMVEHPLKATLEEVGISQRAVAEVIGVSCPTLNVYLRGIHEMPDHIDRLIRLVIKKKVLAIVNQQNKYLKL